MRQYNFFHSLFLCFGSSNFYIDAKENRKGTGFLNLFGVVIFINLICYFIISGFISDLNKPEKAKEIKDHIAYFLDKDGLFDAKEQINRGFDILHQFPEITIENNTILSPDKMPVDIIDPQTNTMLMKIDTSIDLATLQDTEFLSYLTRSRLIAKGKKENEQVFYIENFDEKDEQIINGYLYYLSKLPKLSIKDNLASIDKESPYIIYNQNKRNRPDIVFDMSDDANPNSIIYKDAYVIVTKTHIYFPQNEHINQKSESTNEDNDNIIEIKNINNENMLKIIDIFMPEFTKIMKEQILPSLLLFGTVFYFGMALIVSLATSLIGVIICRFLHYKIDYDEILRLSSFAVLPFIIVYPIFLILSFTHKELIFLPPNVLFIMCLGYISMAILANRNNTTTANTQ